MHKASVEKYTLNFKRPSGTSRGVLVEKDSWFLRIWDTNAPSIIGIGEASIIKTLSPDWDENYVEKLNEIAENIDKYISNLDLLNAYPSIQFAIEVAILDLKNGGTGLLFPSNFTKGKASIPINGLIWMGSESFMHEQIEEKLATGFDCIKMKIGAIDFDSEINLLKSIRKRYSSDQIELRVDANGAFSPKDAMHKLKQLAELDLHSIEQPIKQGQLDEMQQLCAATPLPIALDEELIGITKTKDKDALIAKIKPQYIILKPSLIGGLNGTDKWIAIAEKYNIDWWITSALESNIGLNAIAQYTFTKNNSLPQGLGTGKLYTNNTPSGLTIKNGELSLVS